MHASYKVTTLITTIKDWGQRGVEISLNNQAAVLTLGWLEISMNLAEGYDFLYRSGVICAYM